MVNDGGWGFPPWIHPELFELNSWKLISCTKVLRLSELRWAQHQPGHSTRLRRVESHLVKHNGTCVSTNMNTNMVWKYQVHQHIHAFGPYPHTQTDHGQIMSPSWPSCPHMPAKHEASFRIQKWSRAKWVNKSFVRKHLDCVITSSSWYDRASEPWLDKRCLRVRPPDPAPNLPDSWKWKPGLVVLGGWGLLSAPIHAADVLSSCWDAINHGGWSTREPWTPLDAAMSCLSFQEKVNRSGEKFSPQFGDK